MKTRNKFYISLILLLSTIAVTATTSFLYADDSLYTNAKYGFTFNMNGFELDDTAEDIKTTFHTYHTYVDIFYDNFQNTIHNSNGYDLYSNRFFKNNEYITIKENKYIKYKGLKARVIAWKRKALVYGKTNGMDFTNYALIDILKNNHEVYTIYINSTGDINYHDYLNRFNLVKKQEDAVLKHKTFSRVSNTFWSENTLEFYNHKIDQIKDVKFGFYEPTTKSELLTLKSRESLLNTKFDILLEYNSMSTDFESENFQKHLQEICDDDRILEFTFQTSNGSSLSPNMLYEILDGKHDEQIQSLAKTLASIKKTGCDQKRPVLFRLNNEMDGEWCSYNAIHYNRDSRLYVKLWEYIHSKIVEQGGENVIFVFNPNEKAFPNFKWNNFINYIPNIDKFDIVGVTGYNTGSYYKGETWRTFEKIYDEFMPLYLKTFKDFNFIITEFGSNSVGGDKPAWLENMLKTIGKYNFKYAIYWNGTDRDSKGNEARIYRIHDDPASMEVFRQYFNKQNDESSEGESKTEATNNEVSENEAQSEPTEQNEDAQNESTPNDDENSNSNYNTEQDESENNTAEN